jgi:predicted transcriptional regulator of viral defense system
MKRQPYIETKLANFPFFTINNVKTLFSDLKDADLRDMLWHWVESGFIIRLKRGEYVTRSYFEAHKGTDAYLEYMANNLVAPSYLSDVYVLSQHNFLTEITYPITSITLKTPRIIDNVLGHFIYRNVKSELFNGYETIEYEKNRYIYKATLAKAFFDYIYLRQHSFILNDNYIDSLRFNWDVLIASDIQELSRYTNVIKSKKTKALFDYFINYKLHHAN